MSLHQIDTRPKHDPESCQREPCGRCRHSKASAAPEIGPNPHDAQPPISTPDRVVASIGLPSHPNPRTIAADGASVLDRLHQHGDQAVSLASVLAARGWGSSTLGDGGARSTDETSTTERAGDPDDRHPWADVDRRLAQALQDVSKAMKAADQLVAAIIQHAEDLDPVPVGTGECQACGRFCRPDKTRPGNRLRSGLCPTDYQAWRRAGYPSRNDWVRTTRTELTDENGVLHTPEPDHDIDLTTERLSPAS